MPLIIHDSEDREVRGGTITFQGGCCLGLLLILVFALLGVVYTLLDLTGAI